MKRSADDGSTHLGCQDDRRRVTVDASVVRVAHLLAGRDDETVVSGHFTLTVASHTATLSLGSLAKHRPRSLVLWE